MTRDLYDRHGPLSRVVNWCLGRGHWAVLAHDFDGPGQHLTGYTRHGWWDRLSIWWGYKSGRYPPLPPLEDDPVYQRLFGAHNDQPTAPDQGSQSDSPGGDS